MPTVLATIEQLRAELWLESSLNQLQSRLNDWLLSAFTTNQEPSVLEAEIFQIVVQELNIALNPCKVAIALAQPQATFCKVYYVSRSRLRRLQRPLLGVGEKKLRLKLKEEIEIEDLQHLEKQQPPSAWRLAADSGVIGWLIVATAPSQTHGDSLKELQAQLSSQLMSRAVKQCAIALAQVRQLQYSQQKYQELERFNQQLEHTNQLKNQFLANTSHEIRTPLSSILGFTHLLLAQGYDPSRERHQEYLNIILSSGKHLLALINDILDLSKIEANQLEIQWQTVDVTALCRNVLALVKEKAVNKGLKLCLNIEPNATSLEADSLRLKQMLLNLLFNALKFTSQGSVGLEVKPKGEFVHFTVWDTGTGISKEHQAQLFQAYFQIANAVASREEGTGLGLTVTSKLAELHGGWVEVESEVDRGSSFTIVLPLAPVEKGAGEAGEAKGAQETRGEITNSPLPTPHSPDILLVEDDFPNAKVMQTYLEKLGYQVTWVKNAAEMWNALTQVRPSVILMDVDLPDGNGLQLVQQLREDANYNMIPVIVQTAMAMKGDRETCLAAGVNDYISKPIDLPVLATMVSKYSKSRI